MTLDRALFERVRDDLLNKRANIDRAVDALNVLLPDVEAPKRIPGLRGGPRIATTKKYDPEIEKQAKALFMAGGALNEIAEKIGWPKHTVYHWSKKGKWRAERDGIGGKPKEAPPRERVTIEVEPLPQAELTPSPLHPIGEKRDLTPTAFETSAREAAQIARCDELVAEQAKAALHGLAFRCPVCHGRCDTQEGHPGCLGRKPKHAAVGLVHWDHITSAPFGGRGAFGE